MGYWRSIKGDKLLEINRDGGAKYCGALNPKDSALNIVAACGG